MIDIRDERLFIDNCLVGDENYILGILAKARKYDEIMAENERLFLNDPSTVHSPKNLSILGEYLEDDANTGCNICVECVDCKMHRVDF